MITAGNKWHYLAIINLSALLAEKSSNHDGDFYCLNCFNSYTTKNKLKEHEEKCNNHDSCHIQMPKCFEKILKYNPGEKSLKAPFAIYLNLECLLKKRKISSNEKFCMDENDEIYKSKRKVKDHCHYTVKFRGAAHSIFSLRYKVPENIRIVIHNASYDTHFIINQLAEKFSGELNCIGENMEKYITFSAPVIKKNVMMIKQSHTN